MLNASHFNEEPGDPMFGRMERSRDEVLPVHNPQPVLALLESEPDWYGDPRQFDIYFPELMAA